MIQFKDIIFSEFSTSNVVSSSSVTKPTQINTSDEDIPLSEIIKARSKIIINKTIQPRINNNIIKQTRTYKKKDYAQLVTRRESSKRVAEREKRIQ
jgi:hypothetical protein